MNLSSLLTQVQGLFSRSFWFGSFLPLAVFGAVNLVTTDLIFPGSVRWDRWLSTDAAWTSLSVSGLGLLILAYAVSPLVAVCRGILDGTLLPPWMQDHLRRDRAPQIAGLLAQRNEAKLRLVGFLRLVDVGLASLAAARHRGVNSGSNVRRPTLDPAIQAVTDLKTAQAPTAAEITIALTNLAAELNVTSAAQAPDLEQAYETLVRIVHEGNERAAQTLTSFLASHGDLALDRPQATRVGDARALVEGYTANVYGVEFEYIWPRMQLAIPKDSPLLDRIQSAQGQLDFAVLTLLLACVFPVIWAIVLLIYPAPIRPVLIIGAAAPVAVIFLYELLVKSQQAFGEVVKVVIDKYRLDLLTTVLRQPLPATLSVERDLWAGLRLAEQAGTGVDLVYHKPPAGGSS
jgi:hypothetical protein